MKIVVVPNAFKGFLTATEAAIAMEAGIRKILSAAEVVDVAVKALNGEMRSLMVTGPRNNPVEANFCYVKSMNLVTVKMDGCHGLMPWFGLIN